VSFPPDFYWQSERRQSPQQSGSTASTSTTPSSPSSRAGTAPGGKASKQSESRDPEFSVLTTEGYRILLGALFVQWHSLPPNPGEQSIEVIKIIVRPRGLVIKVATMTLGAFLHAHGLGLFAPAASRRLSRILGSILDKLLGQVQHESLFNCLKWAENALYAEDGRLTDSPDVRKRTYDLIDQTLLRPEPGAKARDFGQPSASQEEPSRDSAARSHPKTSPSATPRAESPPAGADGTRRTRAAHVGNPAPEAESRSREAQAGPSPHERGASTEQPRRTARARQSERVSRVGRPTRSARHADPSVPDLQGPGHTSVAGAETRQRLVDGHSIAPPQAPDGDRTVGRQEAQPKKADDAPKRANSPNRTDRRIQGPGR
jgi:hypothetical protein